MEEKINRIIALMNKHDLVLFVGAGVSLTRPSSLLGFRDLQNEIIFALCKDLGTELRRTYEPIHKEIRDNKIVSEIAIKLANIPSEYVFELCKKSILRRDHAEDYYELKPLSIFRDAVPNQNHRLLAELLIHKYVPAVITTNFDILVEKAIEEVGAKNFHRPRIDRYWRPEHFENETNGASALLKLHGSIDDFDSIVISLDEIGKRCAFQKMRLFQYFLENYHVFFLGFRGADLDIFGCLATTKCKGLIWNTRSEEDMILKIRALLEKNKGAIIPGDLCDILFMISSKLSLIEWRVNKDSKANGKDFSKDFHDWSRDIDQYSKISIIGDIWEYLGEWNNAIRFFHAGYELTKESKDRMKGNLFLGRLAGVFYKIGEYKEVRNICNLLLDNAKHMTQVSRLYDYIVTIQLLALIEGKEDVKKAINLLTRALEYQEELEKVDPKSRYKKAEIFLNVANILYKGQLMDDAIRWYQSALEIFDEYGNVHGRAKVLANIGNIYLKKEKFNDCIQFYNSAEYLFHETRDIFGLSSIFLNLAKAYYKKGGKSQAHEYAQKSLVCFEALSDKEGQKKAIELMEKMS